MKKLNVSAFEQFDKKWALLTAGDIGDYNTMTISWGGLGTLWSRPVATVYVKPVRHTYGFMEKNEYFTISFYPKAFKKDLGILGSRSGRDGNKVALTSLTPKALEHGVSFAEAELTIVCRKIYADDLKLDNIPADAVSTYYESEAPHRMYIGEVVDIIS